MIGPDPPFADDAAALAAGLAELVTLYRDAQATVGAYFPRTSHAFANTGGDLAKARQAWSDDWGGGERQHGQGYNALLGGDDAFLQAGSAADARFAAIARRVQSILTPAAAVEAP